MLIFGNSKECFKQNNLSEIHNTRFQSEKKIKNESQFTDVEIHCKNKVLHTTIVMI